MRYLGGPQAYLTLILIVKVSDLSTFPYSLSNLDVIFMNLLVAYVSSTRDVI